MSNVALILAGGSGTRISSKIPKQFLLLDDKTVLENCVCAFSKNEEIDKIYVVCAKFWSKKVAEICCSYDKVGKIIFGGETRTESSQNGIAELEKILAPDDVVLIHDAARPFVSNNIIAANIACAKQFGACSTCVPVKDTVYQANYTNIAKTLNRDEIFYAQTPQSFKISVIADAYKNMAYDCEFTDDASILLSQGKEVKTVLGNDLNFKITTDVDLTLSRLIINASKL